MLCFILNTHLFFLWSVSADCPISCLVDWEGAEAVEEVKPTITIPKRQAKTPQTNGDRKNGMAESKLVAIPSSESEGDVDSEDDYVSEAARSTMKGKVCCHIGWTHNYLTDYSGTFSAVLLGKHRLKNPMAYLRMNDLEDVVCRVKVVHLRSSVNA